MNIIEAAKAPIKTQEECSLNPLPVCPYCGAEQTDLGDFYEDGSAYCDTCERLFYVHIEQNPQFTTMPTDSTEDKRFGLIAEGRTTNWTDYFRWHSWYAVRHWETEGWERYCFIATGVGSFRYWILATDYEVVE